MTGNVKNYGGGDVNYGAANADIYATRIRILARGNTWIVGGVRFFVGRFEDGYLLAACVSESVCAAGPVHNALRLQTRCQPLPRLRDRR